MVRGISTANRLHLHVTYPRYAHRSTGAAPDLHGSLTLSSTYVGHDLPENLHGLLYLSVVDRIAQLHLERVRLEYMDTEAVGRDSVCQLKGCQTRCGRTHPEEIRLDSVQIDFKAVHLGKFSRQSTGPPMIVFEPVIHLLHGDDARSGEEPCLVDRDHSCAFGQRSDPFDELLATTENPAQGCAQALVQGDNHMVGGRGEFFDG